MKPAPKPVMAPPPNPKRKDMVPERTYDFETPPAPIPPSQIEETLNADVVVVGAGVSGMAAALSAADAGARVLVLEKTGSCHGFGGINGFLGSRLQQALGIEIDREEVIRELLRFGANKPKQELLRMWAYGGAETADWLLGLTGEQGIEASIWQYPPPAGHDNAKENYPNYLCGHVFAGGNDALVRCLSERARERGVEIRYRLPGRQLRRSADGRVTCVIAQDREARHVEVEARSAVILCTGDYGRNSQMVAKYCPQVGDMGTTRAMATGDGHQMAMWIGATMEPAPHATMTHALAGPLGATPFLQVNTLGERFHNEDVPMELYVNALFRQPGRIAWQIFDAKYPGELPRMGIGLGRVDEATDEVKAFIEESAIRAESIEELAESIEVPVEGLRRAVTRYNELARGGWDADYGKTAARLTTVEQPPFFAGKGHPWFLCAMGGLDANGSLQPLDKSGRPIPGLYLAGNILGNRFGLEYPSMLPGLSNGMALHFGRLAGLTAARASSSG